MKTYTDEEVMAMSVKIANEREKLAREALLPCKKDFDGAGCTCKGHAEICSGMEGVWVECSHCTRQTKACENDFDACLEWNQMILSERN